MLTRSDASVACSGSLIGSDDSAPLSERHDGKVVHYKLFDDNDDDDDDNAWKLGSPRSGTLRF